MIHAVFGHAASAVGVRYVPLTDGSLEGARMYEGDERVFPVVRPAPLVKAVKKALDGPASVPF